MRPIPQYATGNSLLAALPDPDAERVRAALQPLYLIPGQILLEPGSPIEQLIFPDSGLVSLVLEAGADHAMEVGPVGREGVIGLPALLGTPKARVRAVVQAAGMGWRGPAAKLVPMIQNSLAARDLVMRYAAFCLAQASANAACAALHPLRQRAARMLLAMRDRTGPGLVLTQEFLATMLGARRPTVNAILQRMKREGLLRTARARIAIADPHALDAIACPCRLRLLEAQAELLPGERGTGIAAPRPLRTEFQPALADEAAG